MVMGMGGRRGARDGSNDFFVRSEEVRVGEQMPPVKGEMK